MLTESLKKWHKTNGDNSSVCNVFALNNQTTTIKFAYKEAACKAFPVIRNWCTFYCVKTEKDMFTYVYNCFAKTEKKRSETDTYLTGRQMRQICKICVQTTPSHKNIFKSVKTKYRQSLAPLIP